jgi:hypothetical protein
MKIVFDQTTSHDFVESTSSFERMPTGLPLLQSHPKTISKLIHSTTHKDKFMETSSNFAKIYFHFIRLSYSFTKNPRALKECQKTDTYIEPTQTLSKINSSPTTTRTF